MRIALVNPWIREPLPGPLPPALGEGTEVMPPLGLLSLAAYLRDRSPHRAVVIDADAERLNGDRLAARLSAAAPDAVGVTAMTHTLRDALRTVQTIKRALPATPLIMGGPHPSLFPEETLRQEAVDFVIAGEGEKPLLMLLDALTGKTAFETVPGLGRQENGRFIVNDERWTAEPLDDLPPPAFDLIALDRYRSILAKQQPIASLVTSRGCPFRCTFCDRPLLKGNRWRAHSPERVVADMESAVRHGAREVVFYDDTFTVDRERTLAVCRLKQERLPALPFSVRTRPDLVDEDLLSALAAARCSAVHYGIESGSPAVRQRLGKNGDIENIVSACAVTRRLGMRTLAYFMIGNPGETAEDIALTGELIARIDPDYLHLTVLMPFPGTPLYREMLDLGMLGDDVWRRFAANPWEEFSPPLWEERLSRGELLSLRRRIYRRFYGRPSYLVRRLREVSSLRDLFAKVRAGVRLFTAP